MQSWTAAPLQNARLTDSVVWQGKEQYALAKGKAMQSIWDWLSLALFAGLAVLYLQRSMEEQRRQDRVTDYFPPAVACAVANYLGNHHYSFFAVLLLIGAIAHIFFILKPFQGQR